MLEELSEEQKINLKTEFNSISSINLKTDFWLNNLKKPYFQHYIVGSEEVNDFLIHPKSEEEFEELNTICLKEISYYGSGKYQVLFLNTEIENFDLKLVDAKNKKYVLENELHRISEIVKSQQSIKDENSNFWIFGYNESYINCGDLHLTKSHPSAKLLIALNNGYVIGEYQKHLERISEDLRNNRDSFLNPKTTIKQQILILGSTGALNHFEKMFANKSEKKELIKKDLIKFLSVLLNVEEQGVKEVLNDLPKKAHLYNVKTEGNFDFLIKLFETIGLKEISEIVKKEQVELRLKKSTP